MTGIRHTLRGISSTGEETRRTIWQGWNHLWERVGPVFIIGRGRLGTSMTIFAKLIRLAWALLPDRHGRGHYPQGGLSQSSKAGMKSPAFQIPR